MTIGVFFGGKNPEHDISILTGHLALAGLRTAKMNAIGIYVGKDGSWHIGEDLHDIANFKKQRDFSALGKWHLDLEASRGKMVFQQKGIFGKTFTVDVAFPAFHGQNGEDGTIQGLFEMLDVPYVGCGVAASAIAMDKVLTKQLYEQAGFPTTKFIYFYKSDWEVKKDDYVMKINTGLSWPLFVKPARLGSSIGIAKVRNGKELSFALDVAFHYDEKVIVEEGVPNVVDLTCAVIGNDVPRASLVQESVFTEDFFSYEDKYISGGGAQLGNAKQSLVIPAELDEATTAAVQNLAKEVFLKFECSGTARVDFLLDKESKKLYVNEINPLPGTLYHHLWEKSGIALPELVKKLVAFALEKNKKKKSFTSTFASNILAHADWSKKLGRGK